MEADSYFTEQDGADDAHPSSGQVQSQRQLEESTRKDDSSGESQEKYKKTQKPPQQPSLLLPLSQRPSQELLNSLQMKLLDLAKAKKFSDAKQVIEQLGGSALPLLEDQESHRTAAHYAAMSPEGAHLLEDLTSLDGQACLTKGDSHGTTPLHLAAKYLPKAIWMSKIKPLVIDSFLTKKDNEGNTCAHIAARDNVADDTVILEIVGIASQNCLSVQNQNLETPLELAMKHCGLDTAIELLECVDNLQDLKSLGTEGERAQNSIAHCAATNPKGTILVVDNRIQKLDPQENCLFWTNKSGETVLQVALRFCSMATAECLLNRAMISRELQCTDRNGNTSLHAVAMDSDRHNVLLKAVDMETPLGPDCLAWKNLAGSSVLQVALEYGRHCDQTSTELLTKLILKSNEKILLQTDAEGNTCLHIAARRPDKQALLNAAVGVCGNNDCLFIPNNKRQLVLFFAMGVLSKEQMKLVVSRDTSSDVFGNTLLHYLFQSYNRETARIGLPDPVKDILDKIKILIKQGVNPEEENNMGQSFLHWSQLDSEILKELLFAFKEDKSFDFERIYSKVEFGSNGLHLVHTFSRKYDLRELVKPLAQLSGLEEDKLLNLTVSDGANKEATCLHFACEGGKKENIRFLLEKGLTLKKHTEFGRSCVDFAIDRGWLELLETTFEEYKAEKQCKSNSNAARITILRLVDPVHRALRLPDSLTAQRSLASIIDHYFAQKSKDPTISRKDRGMHILERAIGLNSAKVYRSALKMDFVQAPMESLLPEYLRRNEQFKKARKNMKNNFQFFCDVERYGLIDACSEISVVDISTFYFNLNDEILPDLILTRQFELIPASIGLLIQLGPNIVALRTKARGKHATLQELHRKVLEIAVNALDELFASSSDEEKGLLFDYIQGSIVGNDGETQGPLFPYRDSDAKIKYGSVLKMIEEADCNELFATDCIYSLAQQEWKEERMPCRCCSSSCSSSRVPRNRFTPTEDCSAAQLRDKDQQSCCFSCLRSLYSPIAKFSMHFISFGLFILYFIWYTVDFKRSFSTALTDIPLVLYFLSFFFQELVDVYRRRKRRRRLICGGIHRVISYFEDVLNFFDWFFLLFMFVGLAIKWILLSKARPLNEAYPCQMVFSVAFTLLMFRSVHFLSISDAIGPVVAMLWSLIINDLFPFLAIIAVIICAFGVFFVNLLFTVTGIDTNSAEYNRPGYAWDVFLEAISLPFNILFTNFDKLNFDASITNITVGKVAHSQGRGVFEYAMLFLFMGLANIVMLNLLIALFNLRVSRMANEALGIWRKTYFGMLREYQGLSPWPPPLSFLWYIYNMLRQPCSCRSCKKSVGTLEQRTKPWWFHKEEYPPDYMKFLEFQANQFRRVRCRLLSDPGVNRQEDQAVLADMASLQLRLSNARWELPESRREGDDQLSQRLKALEDRMAELLAALKR